MEGWREFSLLELAANLSAQRVPLSKMEREKRMGRYPYYGASGVIDFVSDYLFEGEHVLISEDGENLKTRKTPIAFLASGQFWVNNHAHVLRGHTPEISRLLVYFFECLDLFPYLTGAVQPKLSKASLESIPIYLPDSPREQQAIASVLGSLDDKIDLLHRQNRTLEQMAETLFRQWFVEEEGEGWPRHQLGEFVEVMRGLSYNGAGLTEKGQGVPMHNLNSVYEGGGYKYDGIKYYKGDFKDRHLVHPGDVIVTNTEQGHQMLLIGYPAIVPKHFGEVGIFTQHVYKLKMKWAVTEPFIFHLLKTSDMREQIAGATNGSTVNMLPKDGIEWAKFRLPPSELIKRYTATVKPMMKKQETNYEQIQKLTSLRDTLLPKLMSGEVRVDLDTKQ
jgi:type I restriction enzyme, S subunit